MIVVKKVKVTTRVTLLEREMDFIMEFGKFKNHQLDEENKH